MFGIDGMEFLIILLVAVIVIGPKDMPKMLRAFGRAAAHMRALTQEFRGHFDEALRQADMREAADSLKDMGAAVRDLDPRRKLQEFYASLEAEAGASPPADAAGGKAHRPEEMVKQAEPAEDFAFAADTSAAMPAGSGENLDKTAARAVESGASFARHPLRRPPDTPARRQSEPA